jgi:RHS repeat-associated protein
VHHFTPAGGVIDALGRVLCQVQRNGNDPANNWIITRTEYDLRGNSLKIIDSLKRDAFKHVYDLLNRPLRVQSIDAGLRTSVLDAQGKLIEYRDSKGSLVWRQYDALNRLKEIWARNGNADRLTLRERVHYGDEGTHALARMHYTLGRPVKHYDEAGLLEMTEYDFKGNLLEKSRRTIRDDALANGWSPDWSVRNAENALETAAYHTSSRYDALNRPIEVIYPQDVDGERKKLVPHYNRAGVMDAVALDDAEYVKHIGYNARGQRVLVVYGNDVMARYVYESHTFRLARLRTERSAYSLDAVANTQTWGGDGQVLQDFTYSYDLAGNITAIDERTPNCGIGNSQHGRDRLLREFTYDPVYRLLSATGRACKEIGVPRGIDDDPRCGFYPGNAATVTQDNAPDLTERYTESFSYDPAGNMLELNYQAQSGNWKRLFGMGDLPNDRWKDAQNNRLTSLDNGGILYNYTFDANGNLIQQNTERRHTWDHADRIIGYRVQSSSNSPASIEARYLHGANGMRVKKWVRKGTSGTHDQSTVYIDGIFENDKWNDTGTVKENNYLHVIDNQSRITVVRVGEKHPDDGGEGTQYHLGDHLGSSTVVVGGSSATAGSFINREEYFPYGETSFGCFGKKRYRYSGKERDEESGLYYFGARYYAQWLFRWLNCDPAGALDGWNVYSFVRNNPVYLRDLSGLQSEPTAEEQSAGMSLVDRGVNNLEPQEIAEGNGSFEFAVGGLVGAGLPAANMAWGVVNPQHGARQLAEYLVTNIGGYAVSEPGSTQELEAAKNLHRLNPVYQVIEGGSRLHESNEQIAQSQAEGSPLTFEQGVELSSASFELGSGAMSVASLMGAGRWLYGRTSHGRMAAAVAADAAIPITPIPRGLITPIKGRVNVGGGNETPEGWTNLQPYRTETGGPASGVANAVIGTAENMHQIFAPGSVQEMMSSKMAIGSINLQAWAAAAHKVMAPGGKFILNFLGGEKGYHAEVAQAFRDAGFKDVTWQPGSPFVTGTR